MSPRKDDAHGGVLDQGQDVVHQMVGRVHVGRVGHVACEQHHWIAGRPFLGWRERGQIHPVGHEFNAVAVTVGDEQPVVSRNDGGGVEIIEDSGFIARQPCALRSEQPPQRSKPEPGLGMGASVHASTQGVHVVQHFGDVVEVLHVFCAADQLTVKNVGLCLVHQVSDFAQGGAFGEPHQLEGELRGPRPRHAPQPLDP